MSREGTDRPRGDGDGADPRGADPRGADPRRADPRRVVLVPGVLALLPEYAGLTDPVADLRRACLAAVGWLSADVTVLGYPQGDRVARSLLDATPDRTGTAASYLVVGNGTARRSEKAPGHLDERSFAYDDALLAWLTGRGAAPDAALGGQLLAELRGLHAAADLLGAFTVPVSVDHDDDPFGVRYWVMRWEA